MSEEDFSYEEFAICPHCKYVDQDCWEYANDSQDQEIDCISCGKAFMLRVETEVTYTSWKKETSQ